MEFVYSGGTNTIRLRVLSLVAGVLEPVDFSLATTVTLSFGGQDFTASKKGDKGVLEFDNVGLAGVPVGDYSARLTADTIIIAHESHGKLMVRVL